MEYVRSESEGMTVLASRGEGMLNEASLRREARRNLLSGYVI
jgi:hypothetical protein